MRLVRNNWTLTDVHLTELSQLQLGQQSSESSVCSNSVDLEQNFSHRPLLSMLLWSDLTICFMFARISFCCTQLNYTQTICSFSLINLYLKSCASFYVISQYHYLFSLCLLNSRWNLIQSQIRPSFSPDGTSGAAATVPNI